MKNGLDKKKWIPFCKKMFYYHLSKFLLIESKLANMDQFNPIKSAAPKVMGNENGQFVYQIFRADVVPSLIKYWEEKLKLVTEDKEARYRWLVKVAKTVQLLTQLIQSAPYSIWQYVKVVTNTQFFSYQENYDDYVVTFYDPQAADMPLRMRIYTFPLNSDYISKIQTINQNIRHMSTIILNTKKDHFLFSWGSWGWVEKDLKTQQNYYSLVVFEEYWESSLGFYVEDHAENFAIPAKDLINYYLQCVLILYDLSVNHQLMHGNPTIENFIFTRQIPSENIAKPFDLKITTPIVPQQQKPNYVHDLKILTSSFLSVAFEYANHYKSQSFYEVYNYLNRVNQMLVNNTVDEFLGSLNLNNEQDYVQFITTLFSPQMINSSLAFIMDTNERISRFLKSDARTKSIVYPISLSHGFTQSGSFSPQPTFTTTTSVNTNPMFYPQQGTLQPDSFQQGTLSYPTLSPQISFSPIPISHQQQQISMPPVANTIPVSPTPVGSNQPNRLVYTPIPISPSPLSPMNQQGQTVIPPSPLLWNPQSNASPIPPSQSTSYSLVAPPQPFTPPISPMQQFPALTPSVTQQASQQNYSPPSANLEDSPIPSDYPLRAEHDVDALFEQYLRTSDIPPPPTITVQPATQSTSQTQIFTPQIYTDEEMGQFFEHFNK